MHTYTPLFQRRSEASRSRRRGVAIVYAALGMVVFLGVTGLVVDIGRLHKIEAEAQRAADAAALAGALHLSDGKELENARAYAKLNGYDWQQPGVTLTGTPGTGANSQYTVALKRPEQTLFMRILGYTTKDVGAIATAEVTTAAPLDISGGGNYGMNDGVANPSLFGPYAEYEYGDPYSTKYLTDGSLNPEYNGAGYDFFVNIPSDYAAKNGSAAKIEIFDPDCYNADGVDGWDEIREPGANNPTGPSKNATTTVYTLFAPDGRQVAQATVGDDPTTNLKWVTPSGFEFDTNLFGTGNYRLNIKSTDGSSENGFNLRAGPPHDPEMTDQQWHDQYGENGTNITATGRLPMNFTKSGTVTVKLGFVDERIAGGKMFIEKFDTDIGSKSITYTCDSLPGQSWTGTLADNGEWGPVDTIDLPETYKGGNWSATYVAGAADTSAWKMSFSKFIPGQPGVVRLVGQAGRSY
jgi:hypothetical protein